MAILTEGEKYLFSQEDNDDEKICNTKCKNNNSLNATNLSELPDEIIFLIVSFIKDSFRNYINLRQVNKLMNETILEYFMRYPSMKLIYLSPILNNSFNKNIHNSIVKDISSKKSYLKKEMFTSLVIIAFDNNILQSLMDGCEKEHWEKYSDVKNTELPKNSFPNVKDLIISFSMNFLFEYDEYQEITLAKNMRKKNKETFITIRPEPGGENTVFVDGDQKKNKKRFYTKENVTILMKHFPNIKTLTILGYFNPELFEYAPELQKLKTLIVRTH